MTYGLIQLVTIFGNHSLLILILLLIIFLQVGLAKLNQWYNQQAITYKFVTDGSLTSLIILFDMFENIFKK